MALTGFYWLFHGALAGGGRPGGSARNPELSSLDNDLRWLANYNLRAILTLTEDPLSETALARAGVSALHLPVQDFTPPSPEQFLTALNFIDSAQARGTAVYVHCLMGQGRSGTVLAAYLVRAGFTADDAIDRIRALRPGSIVTQSQERAIEDFARRREWIV